MDTTYIGIDPGRKGGLVWHSTGWTIDPMPQIPQVLAHSIVNMPPQDTRVFVCVEAPLMISPGKKAIAIAHQQVGWVQGICAAKKIPLIIAPPKEWKKTILAGLPYVKNKMASVEYIQGRFPEVELPTKKGFRDGAAVAMCLALCGKLIGQGSEK